MSLISEERRGGVVAVALLATLFAATAVLAGQGPTYVPAQLGGQRYEVDALVLESRSHGPQLCVGLIATSLPPQCGGVPVVPWRWSDVDGEESLGGTTWAGVRLVGTREAVVNRAFTGNLDRHQHEARLRWGGALCVTPRPRTRAALHAVSNDISTSVASDAGIDLLSWAVDEIANVVQVDVLLADQATQRWFDQRYGPGVVKLVGRLRPVNEPAAGSKSQSQCDDDHPPP